MNSVHTRAQALLALIDSPRLDGPAPSLAEAVISCADELIYAGEAKLALSLADSARSFSSSAGADWEIRLDIMRTKALRVAGLFDESLALCRRIYLERRAELQGLISETCDLRISEGATLTQLNRVDEASSKLQAVRHELLSLPESSLHGICAFHLSSAEMFRGDQRAARAFALEALVSARRCRDSFREALALDNLGRLERSLCRWAVAEESSTEALAIFEKAGNRLYASISNRCLAIVAWKRGRLGQAMGLAERCRVQATELGNASMAWFARLLEGVIHLHAGDYAAAGKCCTVDEPGKPSQAYTRAYLLTIEYLGDIHLEQGEAERALKHYDEVWPQALALVPKGDIVAELRRRRAECYLLLGRSDDAYQEAKVGLEHCRELGDRYEEAATYRVLGLSAAAIGNPSEAKRWFDQGFAYYDDIETPYEWGKLWMAYGDWLRGTAAGEFADSRGALEAYHAAHGHFERMGAAAKLAEANARIADMMSQQAPSIAANLASLEAEMRRPARRPRGAAEIDRRSAWARETFGFVTRSRMMLDLLTEVSTLASAGSPMLILGESGTGKELIAHGVHRISGRKGTFVPINCSAFPRDVIESELFGHMAGAFTGATRDKPGLFEVCDKGTAFLDEIAEMSVDLQSRLLRFLETGEIRRVGSNRNLAVDTLVVAATNRDRASLEKGDGFRPDLYYRLAHAVIVLPPLRRRGEDVDLLVSHFFEEACQMQGKRPTLSAAARNRLVANGWPGNVRQLRAVLRRLVILAAPDHEIAAHEVQLDDADVASTLSEELEQAERRRMVEALAQAGGSRSDAARALGVARTTFVTKMKRYGIR